MVDIEYQVKIGAQDFSDVIAMDDGFFWRINSFSAESSTGQQLNGDMRVPILGELVQLVFKAPTYITQERLTSFVNALKMGTKGQRSITITYNDPLFGNISHDFYCTNIPWIREKLPNYPYHYASGVEIQLASVSFMKRSIVEDAPKLPINQVVDEEYLFKLNGKDFNDVVAINGFQGQVIEQSLESQTGRSLSGYMELPIIGSRVQHSITCIEYMEVGRFRQLAKELGFGKTGERKHTVTTKDMVFGQTTQNFYCTEISGYKVKLPNYPYHYMKGVTFQQAMKNFVR